MIKVTVSTDAVRHFSGNAKATGKPFALAFQKVWLHTYERNGSKKPYPQEVEIILDKDKDGAALFYPVGEYQLHPSSIYVDSRGNVAVAPRLIAFKTEKAAA